MKKRLKMFSWALRILAAVILLQTLFYKFTGAPESIYIFSTLGMEPWGRIGTGAAELIVSLLLLFPRTVILGAMGGMGIMLGAIISHLTTLGIEVQGDRGLLFGMGLVVLVSCLVTAVMHREDFFVFLNKYK